MRFSGAAALNVYIPETMKPWEQSDTPPEYHFLLLLSFLSHSIIKMIPVHLKLLKMTPVHLH